MILTSVFGDGRLFLGVRGGETGGTSVRSSLILLGAVSVIVPGFRRGGSLEVKTKSRSLWPYLPGYERYDLCSQQQQPKPGRGCQE